MSTTTRRSTVPSSGLVYVSTQSSGWIPTPVTVEADFWPKPGLMTVFCVVLGTLDVSLLAFIITCLFRH